MLTIYADMECSSLGKKSGKSRDKKAKKKRVVLAEASFCLHAPSNSYIESPSGMKGM